MIRTREKKVSTPDFVRISNWFDSTPLADFSLPEKYDMTFEKASNDEESPLEKFERQYSKDKDFEALFEIKDVLFTSLKYIINQLSLITPEHLSLEATYDMSVLIKFRKKGLNVYFEYFPKWKEDELEECIITCFEGKILKMDFSGSLASGIGNVQQLFPKQDHQTYLPNVHRLSFNSTSERELQVYY
ncbi:hypothetical protein WG906_09725 [Pedobacter sp. P351]|uniref:hypothetical protein n=1 Tax=Pedobacter superstes TaxID=3133441 RepID=UPI0030971995